MTNKIFCGLVILILAFTSCSIQERIVFNDNMGGDYKTSFDMSSMMQIANDGRPPSAEKELTKMDTVFDFNDMLVTYKDSIAQLPVERQEELRRMKDMKVHMVMDEEAMVFRFDATKTFTSFDEIEFISYDMEEVFSLAKVQGGADKAGPGGDMLKTEKVRYSFENNTFRRVDPKLLEAEENPTEEVVVEEENGEDDMMKGMMAQFDEALTAGKMQLEYTFPRRIKSVSQEGAVISKDGKTVTFEVDWKTLTETPGFLENFEVVLED